MMSSRFLYRDQPSGRAVCSSARRQGKSDLAVSFLLLLSFFHSSAQDLPPAAEAKFSTDVELVMLDVSVKDHKGGYVSGLTKDKFQIHENDAL